MEHENIHTVVLQEEDMQQMENEEGDAIEYAEVTSEAGDDEHLQKETIDLEVVDEEEEEEIAVELPAPFHKVGRLGRRHCCAYYYH